MTYTDPVTGRPLTWQRQQCCDWEAYDHNVHGVHWHDHQGNRLDPAQVNNQAFEKRDPNAYRAGRGVRYEWVGFLKLCTITGMRPTVTDIECCACHQTVAPSDAYSAVAVDNKNRPRSGFLHCGACMIRQDAGTAWKTANRQTTNPDAQSATIQG